MTTSHQDPQDYYPATSPTRLIEVFDRWLPTAVRDQADTRRRGRLLIGSAWGICLALLLDAFLYTLPGGLLRDIGLRQLWLTILAALILLLVPLWLRLTSSLDLTAALVILTAIGWIGITGWTGGSVDGPVLLLLPLLPILVTILWHERVGAITTVLLFGTIALLHSWQSSDFTDRRALDAEHLPTVLELLALTVLLSGLFAWLTERQRRNTERQLRNSFDRYQRLLKQSKDAVIMSTSDGKMLDVNPAAVELYGFESRQAMLQINTTQLYARPEFRQQMLEQLEKDGFLKSYETQHQDCDGQLINVQTTTSHLRDAGTSESTLLTIIRDVTEKRALEEDLLEKARHDSLTGLPNRYTFDDQMALAIARADRFNRRMAVMMIDLDDFKPVNDRLGHDIGDAVLVEVAARLSHNIRQVDTLARLGGDEMAVIKNDFDRPDDAAKLAHRLLEVIAEPITIESHRITLSASVGIAVFPPGDRRPTKLLKQADLALYRAKEHGKNTVHFYNEDIGEEVERRLSLAQDLSSAIEANQFFLEYQPRVRLSDRQIMGFEALVRWRHPELGVIRPQRFLKITDSSAFVCDLGERIVRAASRQACVFRDTLGLEVPMAVNLAYGQLRDKALAEHLALLVDATGLPLSMIELEVKESQLQQGEASVDQAIETLANQGFRIVLDDFGTSASNLGRLSRLPFSAIKVDGKFVRAAPSDPAASATIKATRQITQILGLEAIAEGIETQAQAEHAAALGYEQGFGNHFCPPKQADDLMPLIDGGRLV